MNFRVTMIVASLGALAACAPQVPDSGRGVGFDNSLEAAYARDAALQNSNIRVSDTVVPPVGGTGAPPPITGVAPIPGSAEATAAETTRILAQTRPAADSAAMNSGVAPLQASPSNPAPGSAGISNENNFDAVAERRSIDADAARIEQNRSQYQVIQPEAVPSRVESNQPNIVAFALSTTHPVGTRVYSRAGLNGAARAERNCAKYPSPDQAQIDFLSRGGPERDRRGLDPDGDGFACSWNPGPFRRASQG